MNRCFEEYGYNCNPYCCCRNISPYQKKIYIVNYYVSTLTQAFTDWFYTFDCDTNIYYVKNNGQGNVIITLFSSPDRNDSIVEGGVFTVEPGETVAINPLHLGRFTRLGYKNLNHDMPYTLKISYLAK